MQLFYRVLRHMRGYRLEVMVPKLDEETKVKPTNMMNLKTT